MDGPCNAELPCTVVPSVRFTCLSGLPAHFISAHCIHPAAELSSTFVPSFIAHPLPTAFNFAHAEILGFSAITCCCVISGHAFLFLTLPARPVVGTYAIY